MFSELQPTPLDIRFQLGPFPVRVSAWFFLGAVFIGWPVTHIPFHQPYPILIWVATEFVSILVHEFGHGIAGRAFGRSSRLYLGPLGGLCIWDDGRPRSGWRMLVTSLAGPAAGLLFAGVLYVSDRSTGWSDAGWGARYAFYFLMVQNIVWSLFNLLPIWPMDGGSSLREILYIVGVRRPDVPTHWAGFAGGATMAVLCVMAAMFPDNVLVQDTPFVSGQIYPVIFFGFLAFNNWQMLQHYSRAGRFHDPTDDDDDGERWKRYR